MEKRIYVYSICKGSRKKLKPQIHFHLQQVSRPAYGKAVIK